MNANLIHKWLRDPKFALDLEIAEEQAAPAPCFLPVEIVDRSGAEDHAPANSAGSAHNVIKIKIAGGHQLRIICGYDPEGLARLIRGLSA